MRGVAVVTGGTRGIGRAISLALRAMDLRVVANFRSDEASAGKFAKESGIDVWQWDVGDREACVDACARIERDLGPVGVLVNNAGITRDATIGRMSFDDWDEVLRVNLGGSFHMIKACFPAMRERRWGRIVNIASVNGQAGQVGQANYSAAKSGIFGLTKALALEGARFGITANAIAPGYVETDMVAAVPAPVLEKIVARIPMGRLGQPGEIARAVAFLAAEESGFITGSTLSINGGQYMA